MTIIAFAVALSKAIGFNELKSNNKSCPYVLPATAHALRSDQNKVVKSTAAHAPGPAAHLFGS